MLRNKTCENLINKKLTVHNVVHSSYDIVQ